MQVFNLSLAYAITFLASNVPYVTFELIIALDKQDNMGPIMAALFGKRTLLQKMTQITKQSKKSFKGKVKKLGVLGTL